MKIIIAPSLSSMTESAWKKLSSPEKAKYIKDTPNSKYAKKSIDPEIVEQNKIYKDLIESREQIVKNTRSSKNILSLMSAYKGAAVYALSPKEKENFLDKAKKTEKELKKITGEYAKDPRVAELLDRYYKIAPKGSDKFHPILTEHGSKPRSDLYKEYIDLENVIRDENSGKSKKPEYLSSDSDKNGRKQEAIVDSMAKKLRAHKANAYAEYANGYNQDGDVHTRKADEISDSLISELKKIKNLTLREKIAVKYQHYFESGNSRSPGMQKYYKDVGISPAPV